ncbi:MAG: histidine kinase [Saprospiraceae bacterium]|nr:histidine kinase [Saprospiraceae bacterium]
MKNSKRQRSQAEMQALRSQMNPHFIFNSLNSINAFIIEHKIGLASDYLTKFSKLMRLILEHSKQELITLDKELESLRLYLLLEKIRFDNSFAFDITIDTDVQEADIRIPPLIIQPFVENAIWHGLMHKKEGGLVQISITLKTSDFIAISIKDNGIGRTKAKDLKTKDSNKDRSYGMQITKERLKLHHPDNDVNVIDHYNDFDSMSNGTEVILTLKIK